MKVQRGAVLSCYHWLNLHACWIDGHLVLISFGSILIFQDFKWKHHNIQFKYAAIQIKDYQTIDCMPLLTLIFNQFTAHVQEHRVRKYENILDSYCWLILCECDVFINLMTPRSKVDLGNLRNLQDSQNLRPLRSRLLAVNDATTRGSLRWRDLIPIWSLRVELIESGPTAGLLR